MRIIDGISPKKLRELYWKQKMSSPEIAEIYHCSPRYIRDLLRKYKIRIRTKSEAMKISIGINISKKQLKKLYWNRKMTISEIAKNLNCSWVTIWNKFKEFNIPVRTLKEAWPLVKPRSLRKNFNGNLEEKAYLMGFSVGDLNVKVTSETSPTIFAQTTSTKSDQIRLVEKMFSPYGYLWKGKPDKSETICIKCSLNRSFDFLLNKKDLIEPWILKTRKYFTAFLSGYIDAEGSFSLSGKKGILTIGSQDKNILKQTRNGLIKLKIFCRPPRIMGKAGERRGNSITHKDVWGLTVYRKDTLLKLIELIKPYLTHRKRRKDMELVKSNILERNKRFINRQCARWDKLYLAEGIKI